MPGEEEFRNHFGTVKNMHCTPFLINFLGRLKILMLSGKAVCVQTERLVCVFLLVSSQLPHQQGPGLLCALRGRLLDSDLIKNQGKRFPALREVRLQTAKGRK